MTTKVVFGFKPDVISTNEAGSTLERKWRFKFFSLAEYFGLCFKALYIHSVPRELPPIPTDITSVNF